MLQLLEFGMRGFCSQTGKLEQIVNILLSQIVKEIAEMSKCLIVWSSILNLHFEEIEVLPA